MVRDGREGKEKGFKCGGFVRGGMGNGNEMGFFVGKGGFDLKVFSDFGTRMILDEELNLISAIRVNGDEKLENPQLLMGPFTIHSDC